MPPRKPLEGQTELPGILRKLTKPRPWAIGGGKPPITDDVPQAKEKPEKKPDREISSTELIKDDDYYDRKLARLSRLNVVHTDFPLNLDFEEVNEDSNNPYADLGKQHLTNRDKSTVIIIDPDRKNGPFLIQMDKDVVPRGLNESDKPYHLLYVPEAPVDSTGHPVGKFKAYFVSEKQISGPDEFIERFFKN